MKKGFTLIELLVVIGILGILAVGLLAAIDPLEQLKKGRDTQKRNIAVEYVNAITRYYAIKGIMPWGDNDVSNTLSSFNDTHTQTLIDLGELKPEFSRALPAGNNPLYLVGDPDSVYVCFDPESKAISVDPGTIYNGGTGGPSGNPPTLTSEGSCTTTSTCYFCAR